MCWELFKRFLGVSIDIEPDSKQKKDKKRQSDFDSHDLFELESLPSFSAQKKVRKKYTGKSGSSSITNFNT